MQGKENHPIATACLPSFVGLMFFLRAGSPVSIIVSAALPRVHPFTATFPIRFQVIMLLGSGSSVSRISILLSYRCALKCCSGVGMMPYLSLATGHCDVHEPSGVGNSLLGSALGCLLLLLWFNLESNSNQFPVAKWDFTV